MNTRAVVPKLGQKILVVMDGAPGFLDALHSATASLPQIEERHFTLLCCHPTHYWEHGGADNPEVQAEIKATWKMEEAELDRARKCLDRASAMLNDAGVPVSHVYTMTSLKDNSLVDATMQELKSAKYTGVIISSYHDDVVNRLQRKGLTDLFRDIPEVEVWPLELVK